MADIWQTPPELTAGVCNCERRNWLWHPRPFAMEGLKSRFLQNISGAALAGNTSPSNRAVSTQSVRYSIDDGLITADRLNSAARRKRRT